MLPAHHSSPARPKPERWERSTRTTRRDPAGEGAQARRRPTMRVPHRAEEPGAHLRPDRPIGHRRGARPHAGNMEAAAMELVEYDHEAAMAKQLMNTSSSSPTHAESEKETKANAEASFWDDVLGDRDVDPDGPSDGPAVEAGAEGSMHAAQALAGDTTPYSSWPVDQRLTVETNGFGAMTEDATAVEKLLGWRASVDAVDTNSGDPRRGRGRYPREVEGTRADSLLMGASPGPDGRDEPGRGVAEARQVLGEAPEGGWAVRPPCAGRPSTPHPSSRRATDAGAPRPRTANQVQRRPE